MQWYNIGVAGQVNHYAKTKSRSATSELGYRLIKIQAWDSTATLVCRRLHVHDHACPTCGRAVEGHRCPNRAGTPRPLAPSLACWEHKRRICKPCTHVTASLHFPCGHAPTSLHSRRPSRHPSAFLHPQSSVPSARLVPPRPPCAHLHGGGALAQHQEGRLALAAGGVDACADQHLTREGAQSKQVAPVSAMPLAAWTPRLAVPRPCPNVPNAEAICSRVLCRNSTGASVRPRDVARSLAVAG